MPLADLPQSVLFLFFLLIFVLIGIFPKLRKALARTRRLLESAGRQPKSESAALAAAQAPRRLARVSTRLDTYEILVLRRLAMAGGKGLPRKRLSGELHLGKESLKQALLALQSRGLILISVTPLFSLRFYLSEKGHAYAVAQDFIPQIRPQGSRR